MQKPESQRLNYTVNFAGEEGRLDQIAHCTCKSR